MDWNAVVNDIGPRLYRYFCVRFPSHLASEMVQETLVRLVHKVQQGSFDSERASLVAYAFGIAHFVQKETNKARWRREAHEYPLHEETNEIASHTSPDLSWEQRQRQQRLRMAIRELSEAEQSVVTLLIDHDLTMAEVAAILNMPLGTVKSHMHRIKTHLRETLNKEV